MYKELELWKLMEKLSEILKSTINPNATECGGDFKEFECIIPNEHGMQCNQYPICLRSKRLGEFEEMLDDETIHISALEAERGIEAKCEEPNKKE